jgi:hypothetical protein
MIIFLERGKEPRYEKMPPPVEEILKIERKLTAKEVEEKFL